MTVDVTFHSNKEKKQHQKQQRERKARQGKSRKGKERARKGKGAVYHSSSGVMNLRLEKKDCTYFFMP